MNNLDSHDDPFDPSSAGDDWQLTAYALGELDAADIPGVEARLARDPAARAEVDAIRQMAGKLERTLDGEASPGLTDAQIAAIHQHAHQPGAPLRPARWTWGYRVGSLIAACAVVGLLMLPLLVTKRTSTPQGTQDQPVALHHQKEKAETFTDADATTPAATPAPQVMGREAAADSMASDLAASGAASASAPMAHRPRRLEAQSAADASPPALSPAVPPAPAVVSEPMSASRAAGDGRHLALGKESGSAPSPLDRSRVSNELEQRIMSIERRRPAGRFHTEAYDVATHNRFVAVGDHPLSTFSLEVDTASYANLRRWLSQDRRLPPPGAVRIEEMVNYFPYRYAAPQAGDEHPLAVHVETASAPWATAHRLVKIGVKGREIPHDRRPSSNLVFLIDVSGSMLPANKLPLLRQAMTLLVSQLDERDRVAIVVYAGAAGMVLDSTPAGDDRKGEILTAIDRLQAGGSTNGGAGIRLAYELAQRHFIKDGVNRVILASDGDFNVGTTSRDELARLIEAKRQSGVFLTVLGFGRGNYKDATMEDLAHKGNGQYAYIDTLGEARKVLVEQVAGTLYTIAKDVKVQVEFNPAKVRSYRLVGYENRLLAKEDFNNDAKDAGDIGAGHTVTAVYEVVPVGVDGPATPGVDPLKYQPTVPDGHPVASSQELLTVKLRYKQPADEASTLLEVPVTDSGASWQDASEDFRFVAAVAQFGMLLRQSPDRGQASYEQVLDLAQSALAYDPQGYRAQFVKLVEQAKTLTRNQGVGHADQSTDDAHE